MSNQGTESKPLSNTRKMKEMKHPRNVLDSIMGLMKERGELTVSPIQTGLPLPHVCNAVQPLRNPSIKRLAATPQEIQALNAQVPDHNRAPNDDGTAGTEQLNDVPHIRAKPSL